MINCSVPYLCLIVLFKVNIFAVHKDTMVTIVILAKDKAHTLDLYLKCIENQTWPQEQTYLYIRTNNNTDNTAEILKTWLKKVGHYYKKIYFDDSDVLEQVQNYGQHEWNTIRFKVLGKIRQDSLIWANEHDSHYFVADCDNFIKPSVIEELINLNLPIVAPFLTQDFPYYSNYHADIDKNGYFVGNALYYSLYNREIRGIIEVPVVHCTYFIRKDIVPYMRYDDDSYRYEYVIFSDNARKLEIPQYLDNRQIYGKITMTEKRSDFEQEALFSEVLLY